MTPRKNKPKYWTEDSTVKGIAFYIIVIASIVWILALWPTINAWTDKTPIIQTTEASFIDHINGIFESKECNNWSEPIQWNKNEKIYAQLRVKNIETGENIPIIVNYPLQSTPETPACITLTGSIVWENYWNILFYTECWSNSYTSFCWSRKDEWILATRKANRIVLVIDASAQSYDNAGSWEKYDTINTEGLYHKLKELKISTLLTQAPWKSKDYRDWVYRNPERRAVIFWDLTKEEQLFFSTLLKITIPQLTNLSRFESYNELINPTPVSDISLFLETISDCWYKSWDRENLCYYDSNSFNEFSGSTNKPLYSKQLISNNKNAIIIFIPTTEDEIKIK